jgi:hypothetical protein
MIKSFNVSYALVCDIVVFIVCAKSIDKLLALKFANEFTPTNLLLLDKWANSELTVQHKLLNLGQSTAVIVFTLSGVISIRGMFKRPLVDS